MFSFSIKSLYPYLLISSASWRTNIYEIQFETNTLERLKT